MFEKDVIVFADEEEYSSLDPSKIETIGDDHFSKIHSFFERKKSMVFYAIRELGKRKKSYCVALFTLILVVVVISTIISALSHLNIVYFLIAEHEVTQSDVIVSSQSKSSMMNHTNIMETIHEVTKTGNHPYKYSTVRLVFDGAEFVSLKSCYPTYDEKNLSETLHHIYEIFNENMTYCKSRPVKLIAIDHEREKKMGLGRGWKFPKLEKGEVYVSKALASMLSVRNGDTIIVSFESPDHLFGAYSRIEESLESPFMISGINEPNLDDTETYIRKSQSSHTNQTSSSSSYEHFPWRVAFPMKVSDVVDDFATKVEKDGLVNEIVIMEYEYFFSVISPYLHPLIHEKYSSHLKSQNPYHFSGQFIVNHPNRFELYTSSSTIKKAEVELRKFGGNMNFILGFPQLELRYPLLEYLESIDMVSMVLKLIIFVIIFIISSISVCLLYMLFKFNLEERKGEFALLRMLGVGLSVVSELIWIELFLHAIPGILLGLLMAQGLFAFLTQVLKWSFGSHVVPYVRYTLTLESVIVSIVIGFLVPILSSVYPIYEIRKEGLSALNNQRGKMTGSEAKSDTNRSETSSTNPEYGLLSCFRFISATELIVGVFGGFFGILMYLVLPQALISMNVSLLLSVFLILLLMMMFGLILILLNVVVFVEAIILRIFIQPWENSAVVTLIRKFLIAHRRKNVKVTLIFSVSVACVIFIAVSFQLNEEMNSYQYLKSYGGMGMVIKHQGIWNNNQNSRSEMIRGIYSMTKEFEALMEDLNIEYAYITFPVSSILFDHKHLSINNVGGTKDQQADLSGISPNFYGVLDDTFLKINLAWTGFDTVSEQLYTDRGSSSVLIGSNMKQKLGLSSLDENLVMTIDDGKGKRRGFLVRPNAFLDSGAVGSFSKFAPTVGSSLSRSTRRSSYGKGEDVFCSFPFFLKILNEFKYEVEDLDFHFDTMEDLPIRMIFVRNLQDEKLYDEIRSNVSQMLLRYKLTETVIVKVDKLSHLGLVEESMDLILYFSTGILLLLSFFSLSSEMWSNIRNQHMEIGVLRAIGLKQFKLFRLFLGESFVLVTSSLMFGVMIGIIIGYSLVIQQAQFSQLPVGFVFPWKMFLVTFVGGLVISLVTTSCIMCFGMNKKITQFMR